MPVTIETAGPYAPSSSILGVINRRRDRGLTVPINADVLTRAGIPESLIPRTLQSLQTLDLIDEVGNPTPTFEALRLAPSDQFQLRMQEWLKSTYADVFTFVDPAQDDELKLQDAFRSYNPAGQQRRMVILFRDLCGAAGMLPDKKNGAAGTAVKKTAPAPPVRTLRVLPKPTPKTKPASPMTGLPPAISGLIASLPASGSGWTASERGKFLKTFEAVIDFAIPVVEKSDAKENGGPE